MGETPLDQALELAESKGLDLVEVAPNAKPPVCKILSWSKFRYEQEKKAREQKKKSHSKKDKGMRFPATTDVGDKNHKIKRVKEFLEKGHRVNIVVFIKGRMPFEKATSLMNEVMEELTEYKTLEEIPAKQGRNLTITYLPQPSATKAKTENKPEEKTDSIPEELKKALSTDKEAEEIFNKLAPSHQKEYTKWIDEAKKSETKAKRAVESLTKLKSK